MKLFCALVLASGVGMAYCSHGEDEAETIPLIGNAPYPEGIISLPNGKMLVSAFLEGSIQMVDKNTLPPSVSYFSAPGANGLVGPVGMAIDVARNTLWVPNFSFDIGNGVPGSQLKLFDLTTMELKATIPTEFIPGVFFNELAIDNNGKVYISDSFNPTIWRADPDLLDVEEFVMDALLTNPDAGQIFGLNGLAISSNREYLVASVMDRLDAGDGRLVRIHIDSQQVTNVALGGAVGAFAGSDGMFFDSNDRLFMVNVFSSAGAIITADFSDDFKSAELVIRDEFQSVYDRPTSSAICGDKLWTVNSQFDHIIDDQNGALGTPPTLPFTIVGVPLSDLLDDDSSSSTGSSSSD